MLRMLGWAVAFGATVALGFVGTQLWYLVPPSFPLGLTTGQALVVFSVVIAVGLLVSLAPVRRTKGTSSGT